MKALLALLAAAMLFAASMGTSVAAPITWSGNGHSYEVVQKRGLTWEEAQAEIQMFFGAGWHLATITSQDEQDWVQGILPPGTDYWLGGLQHPSELVPDVGWSWMTGEPWSYTFFPPGEPNDYNGSGSEQYLAIWASGDWNDAGNADAWYLNGYVAEGPAPVPEPGTFALLGAGLVVAGLLKKCRSRQGIRR